VLRGAVTAKVGDELSDFHSEFEDCDLVSNSGETWAGWNGGADLGGNSGAKVEIVEADGAGVLRVSGAVAASLSNGFDSPRRMLANALARKQSCCAYVERREPLR